MSAVPANYEREFHLSDKEFNEIRKLVSKHTGISLSDAKKNLVYSRLVKRLRGLKMSSFKQYCSFIDSKEGEGELLNFTNAITTNLTSFFREAHHFDFLKTKLIPRLLQDNASSKRIRVWSAGCSTGEEPYSIAMMLRESIPRDKDWDIKILASDLDSNVLEHAKRGVYDEERIEALPKGRVKTWFKYGQGDNAGSVMVHPALKEMISFKRLNLMKEWPMKNQFDFIFCRNVMIYFDKPTQKKLYSRFANQVIDHGHICIGHSETMFKVSTDFELLGNTIYKKK